MLYVTSVRVDEFNAPAQHVRGFVSAVTAAGHGCSLIRPEPRPVAKHRPEWLSGVDLPCWYPAIRGGWHVFERLVSHRVAHTAPRDTDVAYFRFTPSARIAAVLERHANGRLKVLEINGSENFGCPVFARFARAMDLVFVDSVEMKERLARVLDGDGLRVAVHEHPATDTASFRPLDRLTARERLALPASQPIILHVSGFQPHHDFSTILSAVALLTAEFPDIKLLLVGDGPRRAEIQSIAMNALGSKRCALPGAVAPERLPLYIGAADVCVDALPRQKLQEGNLRSYKIYEYLACERPVVETADSTVSIPSWAPGLLSLVDPERPAEMANAIGAILRAPWSWSRRSAEARQFIENNRTWKVAAQNTLSQIAGALQLKGIAE